MTSTTGPRAAYLGDVSAKIAAAYAEDPTIIAHTHSGGGHNATGQAETIPRATAGASITLASGTMLFAYLTPPAAMSATGLWVVAGSTAAATITIGKLGLYSVAANGNLTLVQGSTNDTALLGTIGAAYNKTITAAALVAGSRYAIGVLTVGTTAGTVRGASGVTSSANPGGSWPRMAAALAAQADLPASVTAGSLTATGNTMWAGVS